MVLANPKYVWAAQLLLAVLLHMGHSHLTHLTSCCWLCYTWANRTLHTLFLAVGCAAHGPLAPYTPYTCCWLCCTWATRTLHTLPLVVGCAVPYLLLLAVLLHMGHLYLTHLTSCWTTCTLHLLLAMLHMGHLHLTHLVSLTQLCACACAFH
jgi:hypothetical protein